MQSILYCLKSVLENVNETPSMSTPETRQQPVTHSYIPSLIENPKSENISPDEAYKKGLIALKKLPGWHHKQQYNNHW